jgi:hypothetical protein
MGYYERTGVVLWKDWVAYHRDWVGSFGRTGVVLWEDWGGTMGGLGWYYERTGWYYERTGWYYERTGLVL